MEKLSYALLKKQGFSGYILQDAPEKVLQFGGGNFMRAFVDYWFDIANEKAGWNGKCVIVQPLPTGPDAEINAQQGLYTVYLRGRRNGEKYEEKRVLSSVSRSVNPYTPDGWQALMELAESDALEYIVSNTTEAGIVYDPACRLEDCPPSSFPAKLTRVLLRRFEAGKPGVVVLPCELIDDNGAELLKCVEKYIGQWELGDDFAAWVQNACTFCSTLVDRIVPGAVRDPEESARMDAENGYIDELKDVGEIFGIWNIEGPAELARKLPFAAAGLDGCTVVPDVKPYKMRKVRLLNGAHTGFVPGAWLAGFEIVRDCIQDALIGGFMNKMLHEEIIPTLPLDRADLEAFADSIQDRFNNPFVDHALMSIALNSTSKWAARNMPSLLEYVRLRGSLPQCLVMSFAALTAFYSSDVQALTDEGLVCRRSDRREYTVKDDRWVLEFYAERRGFDAASLVRAVMQNTRMWGCDLTAVPGFEQAAVQVLERIRTEGMRAAFASCMD